MRDIGLSSNILDDVVKLLAKNKKITSSSLFGSRAKGNFKPHSDVDIAIFGDCDIFDVENLILELNDLPASVKFDVVAYSLVDNPDLLSHIDRVGISIYKEDINA